MILRHILFIIWVWVFPFISFLYFDLLVRVIWNFIFHDSHTFWFLAFILKVIRLFDFFLDFFLFLVWLLLHFLWFSWVVLVRNIIGVVVHKQRIWFSVYWIAAKMRIFILDEIEQSLDKGWDCKGFLFRVQ